MRASASFGAGWENDSLEVLWEDGERAFCRWRDRHVGDRHAFMPMVSSVGHQTLESTRRLTHEYALKDHLEAAWALRPLELLREREQTMLVVEYSGGEPLNRLVGQPMDIGLFLELAVALSAAVGRLHAHGLIHKDIKPANVIVSRLTGRVWLTGFGIASRLPRERLTPEPPEFIAGTLAYMAPEQTGRMNRSVDSRSDLYSLGVVLYEMLTGALPFTASDPMEWVHCQVARQPAIPSERLRSIPACVSAIIMKLLAKTAEERYQTAAGVESDLLRCRSDWGSLGHIRDFPLGDRDIPDRLVIPEALYGRRDEVGRLLSAFDRVVAGGRPEFVLVSGHSGIGKSAVVHELHKPLVPPRGLFASGKFDQQKGNMPYATLAQAFRSLIRPILNESDAELREWRDAFREALEPNGSLMLELIPELKHILGEQPPVPELPPRDAQARFQDVLRRFIALFAKPEHPLAIFLDDLQWLDPATLDLLEDLLTRRELRHLLLIGAFRSNEVSAAHPLQRKLDALREAGAVLHEIVLAPLRGEDLERLIADALHCDRARAHPLAELVHEKTGGNPLFSIQFLYTLADEGLLAFDHAQEQWSWDLDRIHAKSYTDNVVDLMVGKLARLPLETRQALQRLACIGNSAESEVLRIVCQVPIEELHGQLWEAVRMGLVIRLPSSYRFLHDRVQEAAYSLIPSEQRAQVHLRIGMLLVTHTEPAKREETIFEIVNHLNRGAHLIASNERREEVAGLNLIAGKRAKNAAAYASALQYFKAGGALLTEQSWERDYEVAFSLEYLMGECEVLTGELVAAEDRLSRLAARARSRHEFCLVTRLRLPLYVSLGLRDRAVGVFVDCLRRDGIVWSRRPTREDVMQEYERIWTLLGDRRIDELADLPTIQDRDVQDTLDVFADMVAPAWSYDEHFTSLVICRLVTLVLEHGSWSGSCFAFAWLAVIAGPRFGNYRDGFRFGQLAFDLAGRLSPTRYQCRTFLTVGGLVLPWMRHPAGGRDLMRRVFDSAYRIGDITFAAYSWHHLITLGLATGVPLGEVQAEAENGLSFARGARFGLLIHICGAQLAFIRSLRGLTPTFGRFDDGEFSELESERLMAGNRDMVVAEFFYWTRKLQARFFAGEYASANEAALHAEPLLWGASGMWESAEYQLHSALARARVWELASPDERQRHLEALKGHHGRLRVWMEYNPETFDSPAAMVGAELARIEGRTLEAQELYERAARSAHASGFVHHEAIANELAASFYERLGYGKIASMYWRDARHCYARWGADGKVRQLERLHPGVRSDSPGPDSTVTIRTPVEHLDLGTVMKVAQAVSGEIVLEKLVVTLMRTAIEYAGADRGLLILPRHDDYLIEAEVTTKGERVEVSLRRARVTAAELPESVFRYVLRTKESVLLNDACGDHPFSADEYLCSHYTRSVLCLPIVKQARLLGMLYLENRLTRQAFTPARTAILELLASGAAISLENAHLYQDLAERESGLRDLQAELARVNRLATMGQLTASIAHEVNQPIGAAHNNARAALRFLTADPPELGEVTEALECVARETYRAGDILRRIRSQIQKAPPQREDFDLSEAVEEVLALARGELSKQQVAVEVRLGEAPSPLHADRVQLQQVTLNLVLNAIEAMAGVDEKERKLLITAESSSAGVLVAVCDSGPGIAPEHRERIFESFYTTKDGGVGIGLSICRSIINAHGGRLWADAHPPRGAAFKFTLPPRQ
jgi:predicted ATPase/signal transduction histidine kinase